MHTIEESNKLGKTFKERKPKKNTHGKKTLNHFKRILLYFFLAVNLYLCLAIVIHGLDDEYSGIKASIMMNRLLLGFIIISIFNWIYTGSIWNSYSFIEEQKKSYFYTKRDRRIAKTASAFTTILSFTVFTSLIVSSFDLLR